ncbi:MAG: hypothetical protein LW865_02145 [Betaproteobacteria bacterium]|jgi:hypothetical protein|nr:hypothetical protein [Betaproteobacteria bacterium]
MSQVKAVAEQVFATFNSSERHGVKFGIVPQTKMPVPSQTGVSNRDLVVELINRARQPEPAREMA